MAAVAGIYGISEDRHVRHSDHRDRQRDQM